MGEWADYEVEKQENGGRDDDNIWQNYKELKKQKAEKLKRNMEFSTNILVKKEIPFVSKNNGILLVVGDYDFFPSTGLFINRVTKERGRGVNNLIKITVKKQHQ